MSRAALVFLLVVPALAHAHAQDAGVAPAVTPPAAVAHESANAAVVATPAAAATHSAVPAARHVDRTLESWIGPLVIGAGGLALVLTAIIGAAQVGCNGATCTEINPLPFTIDLVGGGLLLATAILWWLIGDSRAASTAPGGMAGAADVI